MQTYLTALYVDPRRGRVAWLFSVVKRNVSFVDSLWSLVLPHCRRRIRTRRSHCPIGTAGSGARRALVVAPVHLHHGAELGRKRRLSLPDHSQEQRARLWLQELVYRVRTAGSAGLDRCAAAASGDRFLGRVGHPRRARGHASGLSALFSRPAEIGSSRGSRQPGQQGQGTRQRALGPRRVTRTISAIFVSGGRSTCSQYPQAAGGASRHHF